MRRVTGMIRVVPLRAIAPRGLRLIALRWASYQYGGNPGEEKYNQQQQGQNQYNQYQYQGQGQYQPRQRGGWGRKFFQAILIFAGAGAFSWYMWWPKHTFPSLVAKILRRGLWAESDKGENDYQLALKYYLEALTHCNEIGMDTLSDEYTGIQLKIGEMYERLNMVEDAAFIYNEIATLYLLVLTAPADLPEAKRVKGDHHRRHLIQKDLRLAIKLVEVNRENAGLLKAILITHLVIAQDEVSKAMVRKGGFTMLRSASQGGSDHFLASFEGTQIVVKNEAGDETVIQKTPEVWEPFTDEYFNALDLLGALCVLTGDLDMAVRVKISMTELMILADVDHEKIIMSQCNLGLLLYLQGEEFEAQELAWRKKFASAAGVPFDKIKTAKLFSSQADRDEIQKKLVEAPISDKDKKAYKEAIAHKNQCVMLAIKAYEAVLDFAKLSQLQLEQSTDGNKSGTSPVLEAVALAAYGLGVVNLHLGDYEKAERLLRELRVRLKKCGYQDLLIEIERELGKLFTEKKRESQGKPTDIEMDIHINLKHT